MSDKFTTIRVNQDTKDRLKSLKEHRETDDEVLSRLIDYVKEKEGLE